MRRTATLSLLLLCLIAKQLYAAPTGSPLIVQPVEPCRVLDTRATLGALSANTAMSVYVRGSNLPSNQGGQSDCAIPPAAEAVVINVVAIAPTTVGHLKINGTGGSSGTYSRVNYTPAENIANEMTVGLCNVFLFPHEHEPCPGPVILGPGVYADLQIINMAPAGSSTHIVADVVGYLARMPLTSAVSGVVTDKHTAVGTPPTPSFTELVLDNGLRIVCTLPWSDSVNCENVEIGWTAMAAGHVVRMEGDPGDLLISIYAHGELRVDQH